MTVVSTKSGSTTRRVRALLESSHARGADPAHTAAVVQAALRREGCRDLE